MINKILQDLEKYSIFSNSQLKQDIFVLSALNFKKNGFFVEFGACEGRYLSNTYILEKNFSWTGILAEPAIDYHSDLMKNRNCYIEKDAVYSETGKELEFQMVSTYTDLSGLVNNLYDEEKDKHRHKRNENYRRYCVNSISLEDLLDKYNAPNDIDYLSIDTEGSEYEILRHFNFQKYKFKIITVEHNYHEKKRNDIKNLLENKNYIRVLEEKSSWDDWYINKDYTKEMD